jgi:hypothetical protein
MGATIEQGHEAHADTLSKLLRYRFAIDLITATIFTTFSLTQSSVQNPRIHHLNRKPRFRIQGKSTPPARRSSGLETQG